MRIAVIGTGISGLVASYLLCQEHSITVFEAADYVGGHTHTVPAKLGDRVCDVDTGFIVFNCRTYPNFTRLLSRLGVPSQLSSMSVSVRCEETGLEYASHSLDTLFIQRKNLVRTAHWRMLADIVRFHRTAPLLLRQKGPELTVGEYLRQAGLSEEFVRYHLIPIGASIWSCPPRRFFDFPMRFLVHFLANHGMLTIFAQPQWLVVQGGSARYVEALTRPFRDRIRLSTPVAAVRRFADHVEVVPAAGAAESFDHVVFACHSDQALALLADPLPLETEVLRAFPYQENEVVLHTDVSLLPKHPEAWASWNYLIPRDAGDRATLTYNMNILQTLAAPAVACVTVNDNGRIRKETVIQRFRYHHPLFTLEAPRYQARHHELIGKNRTSYCGAYWGFGFHEDGVRSALAVARAFGIGLLP